MRVSATFCVIYIAIIAGIAGCDNIFKPTRLDIEKILQQDPQFKQALDKKDGLDRQIASALADFYAYKEEIYSKIAELKKEYKENKTKANFRIDEIKSQLDPERERIRKTMSSLNNELKIKSQEMAGIKSRLSTLRNMLNNKKTELAQETEEKWQDELKDLRLKESPLKEEIARLKDSILLLNQELALLKQ